jgi:S1-C subfamily serine protease
VPSLVSNGHVIRPWLGFHGQFIDSNLQELFRIPLATGFLIEVVEPGSPAEKAGLHGGGLELAIAGREFLMGGDIITKINGVEMNSPDKLIEALATVKVGSELSLRVFRTGKDLDLTYTVPERPLLPGDIGGQGVSVPLNQPIPLKSQTNTSPLWRRTPRY